MPFGRHVHANSVHMRYVTINSVPAGLGGRLAATVSYRVCHQPEMHVHATDTTACICYVSGRDTNEKNVPTHSFPCSIDNALFKAVFLHEPCFQHNQGQ